MFEQLVSDIRYALRSIFRYPQFALVVVGTLALGIGGNTAIFSALQSVTLKPIRHPDADRLVMAWRQARTGALMISPTAELAEVWSERSQSFEWIHPIRVGGEITLTGGREARVLTSGRIPTALFNDLGAYAHRGRFFAEDDPDNAVVVSYGYWQSQFGGEAIAGRTIALDGDTYSVIGVAPRGFEVPTPSTDRPDVWLRHRAEGAQGSQVLALLKKNVSAEEAARELNAITTQFAEGGAPLSGEFTGRFNNRTPADPTYGDWEIVLHSPAALISEATGQTLWMLFSAVGLVLLIACLNVANILIARAKTREQEFALRTALGASRFRLLRHAVIESVVLAMAGGAAGLLFAAWAIDAILALRPAGLESLDRIAIDGTVLWFTFGTSVAVGIVLGILPAFHNTSQDAGILLRAGRGLTHRGHRLRATLVTAEVALSMALLVTTALIVRSIFELQQADTGFDSEQLVAGRVNLPSWKYPNEAGRAQYFVSLDEALSSIPGVTGVTRAGGIPPQMSVNFGQLQIEGIDGIVEEGIVLPGSNIRDNYFDVIGQPIVEGRAFTEDEVDFESPVYIVNEAFAAKHFPDGSALRSRIRLAEGLPWNTIVGIVGNVRPGGLANEPNRPLLYEPSTNTGRYSRYIVRTSLDPESVLPTIRTRVAAIDPDVPVRDLATVTHMFARSISRQRFAMMLLILFAATAVSMAAVGIYGVLSQIVSQRTREIGIRVALGASAQRVRRLILSQAAMMTAVGLGVGIGLALFSTKLVESQLFGVAPRDVLSFAMAGVVIAAAATLGAFVPAHRAAVVDPVEAVRAE